MAKPAADLLDELRSMIDNGATSFEIDLVIKNYHLTQEYRSFIIKKIKAYHIDDIKQSIEIEKRKINRILYAIAAVAIIFLILAAGGLLNIISAFLSPIGFLLLYWGIQHFRKSMY